MDLYIFEKFNLITRQITAYWKELAVSTVFVSISINHFCSVYVYMFVSECVGGWGSVFWIAVEITFWLLTLTVCFVFHLTGQFDSCLACARSVYANNITPILIQKQHAACFNGNRILRGGILPAKGALRVYFQSESAVSFCFICCLSGLTATLL